MLGALSQVLAQLLAEGRLARNVAGLVDRVPGKARKFETCTADQVRTVLGGIANDRNRHAWHRALAGLRRGELAGLRWEDVDLGQRTVRSAVVGFAELSAYISDGPSPDGWVLTASG
jgi:integrase